MFLIYVAIVQVFMTVLMLTADLRRLYHGGYTKIFLDYFFLGRGCFIKDNLYEQNRRHKFLYNTSLNKLKK